MTRHSTSSTRRPAPLVRFLAYVRPYRWQLCLATLFGMLKYNLPVLFP
jgi:subfamily B ATP-binding cassette protein MsbA